MGSTNSFVPDNGTGVEGRGRSGNHSPKACEVRQATGGHTVKADLGECPKEKGQTGRAKVGKESGRVDIGSCAEKVGSHAVSLKTQRRPEKKIQSKGAGGGGGHRHLD